MKRLSKLAVTFEVLKASLINIVDIFLGDKKGKEKRVVAGTAVFRGGVWAVVFATAFLVAILRKIGLTYVPIFLILWIGNMILSGSVILANKATKVDFTSMEGTRNLLRKTFEKSKVLGCLLEIWLFLWLLVYAGAEQFIIFFEERFSSRGVKILVFVLASFTYVTIWTLVLMGLADGFWSLVRKLY